MKKKRRFFELEERIESCQAQLEYKDDQINELAIEDDGTRDEGDITGENAVSLNADGEEEVDELETKLSSLPEAKLLF